MASHTARYILLSLLIFLGISAICGGALLVLAPSGRLLGHIPVSILAHSPFSDFLIPGIILLLVLGITPCLLVGALIYTPHYKLLESVNLFVDMHWAWSFTIYIAFALIIWIQVETIYLRSTSWLQSFYLLYAIPILWFALLPTVRARYKK